MRTDHTQLATNVYYRGESRFDSPRFESLRCKDRRFLICKVDDPNNNMLNYYARNLWAQPRAI